MTHDAALAVASGLGFGLSLIVAIGAQNAFVLRQGLLREHVLPVVAVCAAVGRRADRRGRRAASARCSTSRRGSSTSCASRGAAFLLTYAALAARRALRPGAIDARADGTGDGPVARRHAPPWH